MFDSKLLRSCGAADDDYCPLRFEMAGFHLGPKMYQKVTNEILYCKVCYHFLKIYT